MTFEKDKTLALVTGIIALLLSLTAFAAPPSGHWQGAIEVPGNPIEIAIDLEKDNDTWQGSIDIPMQGLDGFPLGDIQVDGEAVSFRMPGVPGDPQFNGELTDDGQTLSGTFAQSGQQIRFTLKHTGDAKFTAAEHAPTLTADQVDALAGRWEGTLSVSGNKMRLAFDLNRDESGALVATFDSLDQGQTGMPVSRLSLTENVFRAELNYAGAAFEATLNDKHDTLEGHWHQGGVQMPLVMHRQGKISPFPGVEPESVGIPSAALDHLSSQVKALVDNEEIVGAEMLIIKDRKTVLHEAWGWKDREAGVPLETDALFCVRSMTKPFVGTAIQMLIDEGRLSLDTPVHTILASFEAKATRSITIEHLLAHRAGFPFTTLTRSLADYDSLFEVAAEAAQTELLFKPGEGFQYSDAGSDTLGAVVAAVSGMPVEQFIQTRILDPLSMDDSVILLGDDDTVRSRIPSAYSGGTGAWSKHWSPSDPALYPIFLTSQSLYSTTSDYARFLAFWLDGGRVGSDQLLSDDAVTRSLTAHSVMERYPETVSNVQVGYGHQWIIRSVDEGNEAGQLISFGHDGSDGTHAWVWPEQDLMVLFFTQSRGTLAGVGLEKDLHALLVEQSVDAAALAGTSGTSTESLAGMYWDETNPVAYYIVTPNGDNLFVDRPGSWRLLFKPGDRPDYFRHEVNQKVWVEFVRDDAEQVTHMKTFFSERIETDPLYHADDSLPSVASVIEQVNQAHRIDRLTNLGAIRFSGSMEYLDRGMKAEMSTVMRHPHRRIEINLGTATELVILDGDSVWSDSSIMGKREITGRLREQTLLDQFSVLLGDWREHYQHVEVIKRYTDDDRRMLLVRVVPKHGTGATLYVDEDTGRVVRKDDLMMLPGMGVVGVKHVYSDFRQIEGMWIPHQTESRFVNELIGRVVTKIDQIETSVDVDENLFANPLASNQ